MLKRKEYGLSQEQLSELIGYSKNHLSNIERGKNVPTVAFLFSICNALGETPDYYLLGSLSEPNDKMISLIKSLPEQEQKTLSKLLDLYISEKSQYKYF